MSDVNDLKRNLAELEARRADVLAELAQHKARLIDTITASVVDRTSLVDLVDALNQVAARFSLMCVVRRLGRRSSADMGEEGDDDIEQI